MHKTFVLGTKSDFFYIFGFYIYGALIHSFTYFVFGLGELEYTKKLPLIIIFNSFLFLKLYDII